MKKKVKKPAVRELAARYLKTVQWSDKDGCFVGTCPGVFFGGVHGDDEVKVFADLVAAVEDAITHKLQIGTLPLEPKRMVALDIADRTHVYESVEELADEFRGRAYPVLVTPLIEKSVEALCEKAAKDLIRYQSRVSWLASDPRTIVAWIALSFGITGPL